MRFEPPTLEATQWSVECQIFEIKLQWPVDTLSLELEILAPFQLSSSLKPNLFEAIGQYDLCIQFFSAIVSVPLAIHEAAEIGNHPRWCQGQDGVDKPCPWWHPKRCHRPSNPKRSMMMKPMYLPHLWRWLHLVFNCRWCYLSKVERKAEEKKQHKVDKVDVGWILPWWFQSLAFGNFRKTNLQKVFKLFKSRNSAR